MALCEKEQILEGGGKHVEIGLFYAASAGYLAGFVSCWIGACRRDAAWGRIAIGATVAGAALHLLAFGMRFGQVGFVPVTTLFEVLSVFGLLIAAIFIGVMLFGGEPVLGGFILPLVLLCVGGALFADKSIASVIPALRSNWRNIHVPVLFSAYACFASATACGIAFLIQQREIKGKKLTAFSESLPSLEALDGWNARLIMTGYPLLTLGVTLGAVWAHQAWGRYWGWDPKETWALITWIVYTIYIHMRLIIGWRGKKSVYLSLAGFAIVLFTFFGVNYLLSGLHSYVEG